MQTKSPILLITVALGLLAIGGAAFMLFQSPAPPPPEQPVVAAVPTPTPVPQVVYVANRDIPPRTVVTSAMLRRSSVSGNVPPDAITSLDDLSTRITKEPIRFGETVKLTSFTLRLSRRIPANFEIPTGFRAVSIWVDPQQTAAGLVDVGDRVDVVATHQLRIDKAPNQFVVGATEFTSGRMVARNLLVLAVDKSIQAPPVEPTPVPNAATAPGAANPATGGPPPVPTPVPTPQPESNRTRVLLAAPPDIATRLVAANDRGKLHVIIRNPSDADAAEVPEAREYPSRTFFAASNAGGGEGGGGGRIRENRSPSFSPPPLPGPSIEPMPPAPTGGGNIEAPAPELADPSKEVTVIRGTEKTRVIVPER